MSTLCPWWAHVKLNKVVLLDWWSQVWAADPKNTLGRPEGVGSVLAKISYGGRTNASIVFQVLVGIYTASRIRRHEGWRWHIVDCLFVRPRSLASQLSLKPPVPRSYCTKSLRLRICMHGGQLGKRSFDLRVLDRSVI